MAVPYVAAITPGGIRALVRYTTTAITLLVTAVTALAAEPVISLLEIRRAHVTIQKWDLSCGAAALTTILKYQHGVQVTEKMVAASLMRRPEYIDHPELIQIREGFSLLDLKRDVDARGYKGIGYGRMELADVLARAPMIVPIQTNGYNHFVIVRGMRNGRVLLADPAWGNRTVAAAQFVDSWISYPAFGKVGFEVRRKDDASATVNLLGARDDDFPILH